MIAISVVASWLVIAGVTAGLIAWYLTLRFAFELISRRMARLDVQPAPWWAGKLTEERGTSEPR